jgi:rubrerythrin
MKKTIMVLLVCILAIGLIGCQAAEEKTTEKQYPETEKNLMAAVEGETGASAAYRAFADKADSEGHKEIAAMFRAFADAEQTHADDEFDILKRLDPSVVKPTAKPVTPGTTKENLQSAIDGETEEYKDMYPGFILTAEREGMSDARSIFEYARRAEEVHANIYQDLLDNFDNFDSEKYAQIYRCPTCGTIEPTKAPSSCKICGVEAAKFIEYEIVK